MALRTQSKIENVLSRVICPSLFWRPDDDLILLDLNYLVPLYSAYIGRAEAKLLQPSARAAKQHIDAAVR